MTSVSMASISEAEYSAIEDALQSTEKGRRFLRAYFERNRSWESRNLLRSISRLHRAALGTPGPSAEVCRDLAAVLRSAGRHKNAASACSNSAARAEVLASGLEEVEACLISLIESLEERTFESFANGFSRGGDDIHTTGPAKLFEEISPYFLNDPR